MDIVDESFNEEQAYISERIRNVHKRKLVKIKPDGYCHNCFEDLEGEKIFCNNKCATQYEIAEKSHF